MDAQNAARRRHRHVSDSFVEIADILERLQPFMERTATVEHPVKNLFSYCLSSSVVRAFDFLILESSIDPQRSYFLVPFLRSITEDVILLRFLLSTSHEEREVYIGSVMNSTAVKHIDIQLKFFRTFRPFQSIFAYGEDAKDVDKRSRDNIVSFWQRNGFPKFKGRAHMPPVGQIAEKSGEDILNIVYEYMYRLTSTTVHFSPKSLLRLGWGPRIDMDTVTFDTKNLSPYFRAVNRIYGSYLLCLYFELFRDYLRRDQDAQGAVDELRNRIVRVFRWPEIVTFEEMNVPIPEVKELSAVVLFAHYSRAMDDGFIAGAREMQSTSLMSGDRRNAGKDADRNS